MASALVLTKTKLEQVSIIKSLLNNLNFHETSQIVTTLPCQVLSLITQHYQHSIYVSIQFQSPQ